MNPFKKILPSLNKSQEGKLVSFENLSIEEVFQRALHYSLFGQNENSALALEHCIKHESGRPEFYLQLARTYITLDRRELSIQILKDLLLRPELEETLKWGIAKFLLSLLSPSKEPRGNHQSFHQVQR